MTNAERIATVAAAARQVRLPDILAAEDLAGPLHVTPRAVREMFRRGLLPGKKLGRRWLTTREEVLRALSSDAPRFRQC
jgi:hypothetical protein